VITQAALMIDSSMASTMTSPDDAFSREVTEANWNQNQTIQVAARSDFLYDGSQTRNLTLTLRKEVGGQTVERRTVAYFVVSNRSTLTPFHLFQSGNLHLRKQALDQHCSTRLVLPFNL
jgi:hypothetical protein